MKSTNEADKFPFLILAFLLLVILTLPGWVMDGVKIKNKDHFNPVGKTIMLGQFDT